MNIPIQRHRLRAAGIGLLVCVLAGGVGLAWVIAGKGAVRKLEQQVQAARRNETQFPGPACDEAESIQWLEGRIQAHARKLDEGLLAVATPSVIELTASIQTLIHSYPDRFVRSQIEVDDGSFGFAEHVREVAVMADPVSAALMATQLEAVRTCLEAMLQVNPVAVVAIQRSIQTVETAGEERTDPKTGFSGTPFPRRYHTLRLTLEWDGYTRTLRDLLNERQSLLPKDWRIVRVSVQRSERSEPDRSSILFDTRAPASRAPTMQASPFAAYLQAEAPEPSGQETTPLIGEVVSRFRLILEKEVFE